jgi:hypothetical protein
LPQLNPPDASRQVRFHQLLVAARKTWLSDALSEALAVIDPATLKKQVTEYVPAESQQILAAAGIRDEHVFPTPIVLETKPTLVGYYRLLLGSPQKSFYGSGTGLGRFKSMEMDGILKAPQKASLPEFCATMSKRLADLVAQVSPEITNRDVAELQLITLGSFFQGQNNVEIGKQATKDVFLAVAEIVKPFVVDRNERSLTIKNASGRTVRITLASDPDIRIEEEYGANWDAKVAIEIKGGTDFSNVHNRAGEAEKSQQKARGKGYRDFWTIIALKGVDMKALRAESPTTTSWFDVAEVLGREGSDWDEFRNRIANAVGIPLT